MCSVPDKIVRQNGILIRICELPGQRLLAVKMRRMVDIAKVEQQDADMFGRSESSCLIEIKVSRFARYPCMYERLNSTLCRISSPEYRRLES